MKKFRLFKTVSDLSQIKPRVMTKKEKERILKMAEKVRKILIKEGKI